MLLLPVFAISNRRAAPRFRCRRDFSISRSSAIDEENRIKGLSRKAKIELIEKKNPEWKELVTEKCFIYDKTPWSEKVKQVLDNLLDDQ